MASGYLLRCTVFITAVFVLAAPVMGMVVPSAPAPAAGSTSAAPWPVLSGGYDFEDESSKMFFIIGGVIFVFAMIVTM